MQPRPQKSKGESRLGTLGARYAGRFHSEERATDRCLNAGDQNCARSSGMTPAWPSRSMGEIAPLVRRPVQVEAGGTYREIGIRSFGRGIFHKPPSTGLGIGDKRVFSIEPGDLLFNIVFAWEGAVAVASETERNTIGSHRFLTCVANPQLADARFLFWWFSRGEGRDRLLRASPGGAGRNRTLGVEKLGAIDV